jgi:tight adherence protein B
MSAVMRALVHRLQLTDIRIFTTTLTVHRQTGGNLAWTLERLAGVIRERLAYRRQMRASTAAGRMSATLIAAIGPLLFVYLFFAEPQYVSGLTQSPLGQSLLAAAVFLEIAGLLWIARMLRSDF